MVTKKEEIMILLSNVIENCEIIKSAFENEDEVHCYYLEEKLNWAKESLDELNELASEAVKKNNKNYVEE